MKDEAVSRQPPLCTFHDDRFSAQLSLIDWQHDCGTSLFQSRYELIPQHPSFVWASSQADLTAESDSYSEREEYIPCRTVSLTFSRNFKLKTPPTTSATKITIIKVKYCRKIQLGLVECFCNGQDQLTVDIFPLFSLAAPMNPKIDTKHTRPERMVSK